MRSTTRQTETAAAHVAERRAEVAQRRVACPSEQSSEARTRVRTGSGRWSAVAIALELASLGALACSVYEGGSSGDASGELDDAAIDDGSVEDDDGVDEGAPTDPSAECDATSLATCVGEEQIEFCDAGLWREASCSVYCLEREGIDRMDAECQEDECLCGEPCFTPQPTSGIYSPCINPGPDFQCNGFTGTYVCSFVSVIGLPTEDAFCTVPCNTAADCPSSGCTALPACRYGADIQTNVCALDCSEGRNCPTGMMCKEIADGGRWCF
jgi:hypothetical protein